MTIFLSKFNPLATRMSNASHTCKINQHSYDCSVLISTLKYNLTIHFTGDSLLMSTYSKHLNSIETTFTLTLLDLTIMYSTPFLNEKYNATPFEFHSISTIRSEKIFWKVKCKTEVSGLHCLHVYQLVSFTRPLQMVARYQYHNNTMQIRRVANFFQFSCLSVVPAINKLFHFVIKN